MASHPAFVNETHDEIAERRALLTGRLEAAAAYAARNGRKSAAAAASLGHPIEPIKGVGARSLIGNRRKTWMYGGMTAEGVPQGNG